jgi:hypothetical protein
MINIIKGFLFPSVPNGKPVNEDRYIELYSIVEGGSTEPGNAVIPVSSLSEGMLVVKVQVNLRTGLLTMVEDGQYTTAQS